MSEVITDPRLEAVLANSGYSRSAELPCASPAALSAVEHYLNGNSQKAIEFALSALRSSECESDSLLLLARCIALEQEEPSWESEPFLLRLASRIASVIRMDEASGAHQVELTKYAINAFGTDWSFAILHTIVVEMSPDPASKSTYTCGSGFVGTRLHPLHIHLLPQETRSLYAERLNACPQSSVTQKYVSVVSQKDNHSELPREVPRDYQLFLASNAAYQRGDFLRADQDATSLLSLKELTAPHKRYALRLKVCSLLRLQRVREAVLTLVSGYVEHRSWRTSLPIDETAAAVVAAHPIPFSEDIEVPILFDVHVRFLGAAYESERTFAFIDFLEHYDFANCFELVADRHKFDVGKLVYFLRYVWIESVMDKSGRYSSSKGIIEERLAICRHLVEMDESNADAYHVEIKSLLRRLMVQRRMKEVEQSKIFVDTDSIRRRLEEEIREPFSRFLALRRERPDVGVLEEVANALRKAYEGDTHDLANLVLPRNEQADLFASIVRRVRDEYVSSPEHGLDKYLSVRVRHGTLAAHLRRPLETARLITNKKAGSGEYRENEWWKERLWNAPYTTMYRILERLRQFSGDFDKFVEAIKSWIQIYNVDTAPTGMFDFSLNANGMRVLAQNVSEHTTFDEFIEHLLESFGVSLDLNLERVRDRLISDAKPQARQLLDELASDIAELREEGDVGELLNAIRTASTEVQVTLDRITAWFQRSLSTGSEPFAIQDAVELSVEAVRTVSPLFSAELTGDAADEPVILNAGPLFPIFVDIFFIVLENVVRHSGAEAAPVALMHLHTIGNRLVLTIENEVSPQAAAVSTAKVSAIQASIKDDRHAAFVIREGGTGFHKLSRLLTHDLGILNPELDFGFKQPDRFFVTFSIPTEGGGL